MVHLRTLPFSVRKNQCMLSNVDLPPYPPPLNLLDYGIWGILQVKGNAMAHPKMGSLKRTIRQLRAAEVR
jgi:hypothetical protein